MSYDIFFIFCIFYWGFISCGVIFIKKGLFYSFFCLGGDGNNLYNIND